MFLWNELIVKCDPVLLPASADCVPCQVNSNSATGQWIREFVEQLMRLNIGAPGGGGGGGQICYESTKTVVGMRAHHGTTWLAHFICLDGTFFVWLLINFEGTGRLSWNPMTMLWDYMSPLCHILKIVCLPWIIVTWRLFKLRYWSITSDIQCEILKICMTLECVKFSLCCSYLRYLNRWDL
jgi:hypothetical protein